ncbi:MAG: 50S ribosomal protein L18 [Planctomycetota bacterium]|jgi:large subunit ribosomal protein L18|nr:50S ribosomal protein L18 [Planctomycetota bacterium]
MRGIQLKNAQRKRRMQSVRRRIRKHSSRVRLSVFRSSKHFSAQIIDDEQGKTLCAISTTGKEARAALAGKKKSEQAAFIGGEIAKRAIEAGVKQVVLDRGPYKYHGRVKAFGDAAREGGLDF